MNVFIWLRMKYVILNMLLKYEKLYGILVTLYFIESFLRIYIVIRCHFPPFDSLYSSIIFQDKYLKNPISMKK